MTPEPTDDWLAAQEGSRRHTPPRSVRIPDQLWNAAKNKAAERSETVTDVLVRALERYVKR